MVGGRGGQRGWAVEEVLSFRVGVPGEKGLEGPGALGTAVLMLVRCGLVQ